MSLRSRVLCALSLALSSRMTFALPPGADEVERGIELYWSGQYRETVTLLTAICGSESREDLSVECYKYLAFSHVDPIGYRQIKKAVEARRKAGEHFLEQIEAVIREKLKENGIEARVESRIKRYYSIYQKLQRQQITVDQVYDLLAIRIIGKSVKDCYATLGTIHNLWQPVPGDHGAHGRFDAQAHPHSTQAWMTTHRGATFGAVALGTLAACATAWLLGPSARRRWR